MPIKESSLKHWIDNFYGYGSWRAKFWFVGHEESGGEVPEEVEDKLNYFDNVATQAEGTLCDIRDLYKHVAIRWDGPKANLFNNRYEYRFDKNAVLQGIWKNLIAFEHGYKNEALPEILPYQQHTFVSPSAHKEALISLYPLPGPHSHSWYYSWLGFEQLGFLKTRTLYEEHLFQRRIKCILSNIPTYKPEVVLMYGMNNINGLKKSIQETFPGATFKMIKSVRQQTPQHHRVDVHGTTILITTQIPALRHNRIETGFDWQKFGSGVVNGNR